ncbi:MAG: glyoxalase superfamily protein [Burkholderiaceae bacterium]
MAKRASSISIFLASRFDWEHRFDAGMPLYLQIGRGDLKLHLSEHHGDATPGSTAFVRVDDVASLHAELNAKAYPFAKPGIDTMDWGRVLQVADPFGNRLRFCELAGD